MIEPAYQREGVTLYCGDSLEILPQLPDGCVDAVVTDPPYGIQHRSHGQVFRNAEPITGDESSLAANGVRLWARQHRIACAMFFSPYHPMLRWRTLLCWSKGAHVGIGGDRATCWKRDFELIGVEGNGPLTGSRDSGVIHMNALLPPPSGHLAEKPVAIMEYLIVKLAAARVCDPFMGSGTTGVACVQTGRRFLGIEIEPKYFDIAVARIDAAFDGVPARERAQGQRSLFTSETEAR